MIHFVAWTLYLLCGLMGIFAAMGLCVAFWGPQTLHTALGDPPDHTQPAFWVFIAVMVPAMIVGCAGGLFVFVVPLYAFFDLRMFNARRRSQKLFAMYIRLLQRVCARTWPDTSPPKQVDRSFVT